MLNRKSFIASLAILVVLGLCGMSRADSDYMQYSGNGHFYQRFDNAVDWQVARDACAAQSGYLATVTSPGENNFIYTNLVHRQGNFAWLGATDEVVEGAFVWVTGEPVSYTNWDTVAGEPNDGYTCNPDYGGECLLLGQDYVAMYAYTGKWFDIGPPMEDWRLDWQTADSYVCEWGQTQDQVPMPNVVGMTQAMATTAITAVGLTVGLITNQPSDTFPAGYVISQSPAAGTSAALGSAVNLVISMPNNLDAVPNVVGTFYTTTATATITNAGLTLGTVTMQESSTVPPGYVISQNPAAGVIVSPGTAVNLVVSGINNQDTVPNVVGRSEFAATTLITQAGFVVGTVTQQESATSVGTVLSQNPAAGTPVSQGSTVNLVVSMGIPIPNVVGMTQAAATTAITTAGFVVGTVTSGSSTTVPAGYVGSQNPSAGLHTDPGRAVNLFVSTGPSQDSAKIQWTGTGANNHSYQRIASSADWHTAKSACAAQGGYLATVTSAGENDFIYNNLVHGQGTYAWLGATDEVLEGTFVWVTGEPWSYTNWDTLAGEPNNGFTCNYGGGCLVLGQDYAAMYAYNGKWYDIGPPMEPTAFSWQTADSYVCEWDALDQVSVPNVVGMTQAAATATINAAGLVVGNVTQQPSPTVPAGYVGSQNPAGGASVALGSAVNLTVSTGPSQDSAKINWTGTGANNHYYQRFASAVDWHTAKAACLAQGGYLATVTSAGENDFIYNNLVHRQGNFAWLGATDEVVEGTFAWVTDEPWSYTNWDVAAGEPSNGYTCSPDYGGECLLLGQDYAAMYAYTGKWFDIGPPMEPTAFSWQTADSYVCEWDAQDQVSVPNVVTLLHAAATATINATGLVVGNVTTQSSAIVPAGSVISQNPAAATYVNLGSAVNLVESSGLGNGGCVILFLNTVGMTQAQATANITEDGLVLGTVVLQASATVPVGKVISQSPAAGTCANPGTAINLVLSTGVSVPDVVGMTQAAATTAITNAGLVVGAVIPRVSATYPCGIVNGQDPTAGTSVNPGSAVNLFMPTGGCGPVAVPNVVGLTQAAATTSITGAGLILGIVAPTASTTVPVGMVISSTPTAGTTVNPGSAVNLAVSTGVSVPDVVGLTQAAATTAITNAGLILGTITPGSSPTVPLGMVISTTPVAGTRANGGSAVNLVISTACCPPGVPNVVGLTQAAATTAITGAGLILGTVSPQASTTVPVGLVISQSPAAGTNANPGSAVNLAVSTGVSVPDVVGMTQAAAATAITNAGLIVGTITLGSSPTVPVGMVISTTPVAGTRANGGSAVNLVISTACCPPGVPNVVGMTQAAATTAITGAGLILGTVSPQASTTVPVGLVISQSPAAGTNANPGSAVNLVVSTGCSGMLVPDVRGCRTSIADITAAGIVVGTVTAQTSKTVPIGCIISQSPAAGTCVAPGTVIVMSLVVSSGVSVPNLVSRSQAAATAQITGAGLILGTVSPQASATVPAGLVIRQTPAAGTLVDVGSLVNFVVSSGPLDVQIQTDVTGLTVPEGRTGQIQVRLDRQPPSNIVIAASLVTADPDMYISSGATLTFTPSNWDTYQPVKIVALPDEDMLNDTATLRLASDVIAAVEVPVTEIDGGSCASIVALPKVNGSGATDLAELHFNPANSAYSILVKDGGTRKSLLAIPINASYLPVSVALVGDSGPRTLAVLERQVNTGSVRCEIIDADTGIRGTPVAFGKAYVPKALAVLHDMNGNGSVELAVLGAGADGTVSAQIRDSLTGTLIRRVGFGKLQPYAFCSAPGVNANSPGLAFLYKNQLGTFAAMIKDAQSGQFVKTITFRKDYTPTAMHGFGYGNGEGKDYLYIAVLGFNAANKAAVQIRDISTGVQLRFIPLGITRVSPSIGLAPGPSGWPALVFVGTGTSGSPTVEIRDTLNGDLVKSYVLTGAAVPRGLIGQYPTLSHPVAKVLRLEKSTGATSIDLIEIYDNWML